MVNRLGNFLRSLSDRRLAWIMIALAVPAFLVNLDVIAFIGDEGIRALVAFEMDKSGNYLVPTLNGELYFNKPPLYNWMILGMSKLFGYFGEWPSRLTTLLCLAGFAWAVYAFTRRHFGATTALTQATLLLTSGRILLWDSMLGLIDIGFSAVIFINFMVLFEMGRKASWRNLWILSYALFAIAFMLKGLPAVVFQGISVAVTLTYYKAWRSEAFSRGHLLAVAVGLIPLALYYGLYASHVDLNRVFGILLDQSMQRTPTHHTTWETISHILTFPFEQVYHFLPWSLLLAVVVHPAFRRSLRAHPFVHFCFWMLVANLPVYWISAQVYPRYLLMFVPLFNLIGLYMLGQAPYARWQSVYRGVFLFLTLAAALGSVLMPLLDDRVITVGGWPLAMGIGSVGCLAIAVGLYRDHARTFLWMALAMLIVRIVFDIVVLPLRSLDYRENLCRTDCRRLADAYGTTPWYIYGHTYTGEVARFYTSAYTDQWIRHVHDVPDSQALYIVDRPLNPSFPGVQVDSLLLENRQIFALMRPTQ